MIRVLVVVFGVDDRSGEKMVFEVWCLEGVVGTEDIRMGGEVDGRLLVSLFFGSGVSKFG